MALKRILGTAVRHPIASTALVAGVAKGTLAAGRRLAGGKNPLSSPAPDEAEAPAPAPAPEVVPLEPQDRDLPEPVVLYAQDEEPEPVAEVDLQAEDELVWTSESPQSE